MVIAIQEQAAFVPVLERSTTSTEYERESLDNAVNLSDGHARQPLTLTQEAIIDRASEIFRRTGRTSQFQLEVECVDDFLLLAGEPQVFPIDRYF